MLEHNLKPLHTKYECIVFKLVYIIKSKLGPKFLAILYKGLFKKYVTHKMTIFEPHLPQCLALSFFIQPTSHLCHLQKSDKL